MDGAESYSVKYAILTKEQFEEENLTEVSFVEEEIQTLSIALSSGNYFYIEIYAKPENASENLTSQTLKEFFYLSKHLDAPNIQFVKGVLGEETSESFYIQVENVENIEN